VTLDDFRTAGFSDDEIRDHFVKAGFTPEEVNLKLSPSPSTPSLSQASTVPTAKEEALQGVLPSPSVFGHEAAKAFNEGAAGLVGHFNDIANHIEDKEFTKNHPEMKNTLKTLLPTLKKVLTDNTAYWQDRINNEGESAAAQFLGEASGAAVPGVTEFALGVPYAAAIGATEAEKAGTSETWGAIKGAANRYLLGKAFDVINKIPSKPAVMAATSALFGAQAALQGGSKDDIIKAAGTGALYGMTGGRRTPYIPSIDTELYEEPPVRPSLTNLSAGEPLGLPKPQGFTFTDPGQAEAPVGSTVTRKGTPGRPGEMQGEVPVEYKPLVGARKKPFTTEASARKAAVEVYGLGKNDFDIIPHESGKGFAIQQRPTTLYEARKTPDMEGPPQLEGPQQRLLPPSDTIYQGDQAAIPGEDRTLPVPQAGRALVAYTTKPTEASARKFIKAQKLENVEVVPVGDKFVVKDKAPEDLLPSKTHLPFPDVIAKHKIGEGNYEVGDTYWWEHPNPNFKQHSHEVMVAGPEIDGKIPTYSWSQKGNEALGIPPESAIPELTPKGELSLLPDKTSLKTPKSETPAMDVLPTATEEKGATQQGQQIGAEGKEDTLSLPASVREIKGLEEDGTLKEELLPTIKNMTDEALGQARDYYKGKDNPFITDNINTILNRRLAAKKPKEEPGAPADTIETEYDKERKRLGVKTALELPPNSPESKHLRELSKNVGKEAVDQYSAKHPGEPIVLLDDSKKRGVVIHPSSKEEGKIQTTYFDERGFSGDESHNTEQEAAHSAIISGYKHYGKDLFNQYMGTDLFHDAMAENKRIHRAMELRAHAVRGKEGITSTDDGQPIDFQYAVYNKDDLITSHDDKLDVNKAFPPKLQPRSRERAASIGQVDEILRLMNPPRLGENPLINDGAPVVGPDLVVEIGNGRTIALRKGYNLNHKNMAKYRAWLMADADKFGLDKKKLANVPNPILVRERLTDVDREDFVRKTNKSTTAAMSATEDALADANAVMKSNILGRIDIASDGSILTAKNIPLFRDFFALTTTSADIGRYVDAEGKINQAGLMKIRNAIFAAAYGDSSAVGILAEDPNPIAQNITKGMLIAGPGFARAKAKLAEGVLIPADITPEITKAAEEFRGTIERGESIDHFLAQMDMFNPVNPTVAELLSTFHESRRSGQRVGKVLQAYVAIWEGIGDPKQARIFDDGKSYTKNGILLEAIKGVKDNETRQTTLGEVLESETGGTKGAGKTDKKKATPQDLEIIPAGRPKSEPTAGKLSPETAKKMLALPWTDQASMTGPSNIALRKQVMKELTGKDLPINKVGCGKVQDEILKAMGSTREGKATVQYENEIREWVKKQAEGTPKKPLFRKKEEEEPSVPESIKINPHALTKDVLNRMNKTLKSMGYDVRGSDDIKGLLKDRMARNGEIVNPDWISAYIKATEGIQRAIVKRTEKTKYEHIDRSRIRQLGYTSDIREAGYITPKGDLIDLSGKREGGSPGTRAYDHREAGGTFGMQEFMAEGNIRMDYNASTLDIATLPTTAQLKAIERFAAVRNGGLVVDLQEGLGKKGDSYYEKPERSFYNEYTEGTKPTKIINDIKKFYAGETPLRALFRRGEPWYSQLEESVKSNKFPDRAPGSQMAQALESWAKTGDIKQEELDWSGVTDWLKAQGPKVTKDQVLEYLRANNVQIKEVTKGPLSEKTYADLKAQMKALTDQIESAPMKEDTKKARDEFSAVSDKIINYWGEDEDPDKLNKLEAEREVAEKKMLDFYKRDYGHLYEKMDLLDEKFKPADIKFTDPRWLTPGGEKHREMLLVLPEKGRIAVDPSAYRGEGMTVSNPDNFRSAHWDEPNVLAHIRFNDRTDADGKKVLFIDEIQSDWAQIGRKEGYKKVPSPERKAEIKARQQKIIEELADEKDPEKYKALSYELNDMETELFQEFHGLPNHPFKKTWPMLSVKRMVRYAAENGYDRIAWTTGDMQNERYDLSKQVKEIEYEPRPMEESGGEKQYRLSITAINGEDVPSKGWMNESELEGFIGKDITKKIIDGEGTKYRGHDGRTLEGLDLKVGGQGMKGFYDKILPAEVNKFFGKAKWGNAKVGETNLVDKFWVPESFDEKGEGVGGSEEKNLIPVHSLDITPEMKAKALEEGMPLFKPGEAKGKVTKESVTKAIKPLVDSWKNSPDIHVLQSIDELPEGLHRQAKEAGRTSGIFYDDQVYLIADGIDNIEDAQRTILHETLAHWGLRRTLGPGLDPLLDKVWQGIDRTELAKIMARYGLDVNSKEDRRTAAEEYIAKLAEKPLERPGLWKRFLAGVRELLRKMGFNIKMSLNDVGVMISKALRASKKYMMGKDWKEGRSQAESEDIRMKLGKKVALLKDEPYDIHEIDNKRFMYNPKTKELVLGDSDLLKGKFTAMKSHAEEHHESGAKGNYDDFVKGWIGTSKRYPDGVIHFAPAILRDWFQDPKVADETLKTIEHFIKHGANKDTILRGFIERGEQRLGDAVPDLLKKEPKFQLPDKPLEEKDIAELAKKIDKLPVEDRDAIAERLDQEAKRRVEEGKKTEKDCLEGGSSIVSGITHNMSKEDVLSKLDKL
jgi:hypothetical protein